MMKELFSALTALLAQSGVPVYLEGCVPRGTIFPYVTAEVSIVPEGIGSVSLTLWCSGQSANEARLALCDTLLTLIPHSGLKVKLEGGLAVLSRAKDAGIACRREADALGLSLPLELRLHPRS